MKRNSSFKGFFALYFAALFLCVGVRVWFKFNAMDPATGFYTGARFLAWGLNAVMGLCVASLFLIYLLRRTDSDYPVLRRYRLTAFFALLTGISIALYQLEAFGVPVFGILDPGVDHTGITFVLSLVAGGLSAIVFIFMGMRALFGKGQMRGGILTLIGGAWLMIIIVGTFNSYTTLTTISDNLLAVLFMLFCALFLAGHARTLSGLSRKNGRNYTIPSGLSASLFGFLLVIPNWTWMAVNRTLTLPAPMLGSFESLFIFLMSVYALLFVRHVCLSIRMV